MLTEILEELIASVYIQDTGIMFPLSLVVQTYISILTWLQIIFTRLQSLNLVLKNAI